MIMKRLLLLLLSSVMLLFAISCEDDPADFLVGTEWTLKMSDDTSDAYSILKFGETTFDLEIVIPHLDEMLTFTRSGTYSCNESTVILMSEGVICNRGLMIDDFITFDSYGIFDDFYMFLHFRIFEKQ